MSLPISLSFLSSDSDCGITNQTQQSLQKQSDILVRESDISVSSNFDNLSPTKLHQSVHQSVHQSEIQNQPFHQPPFQIEITINGVPSLSPRNKTKDFFRRPKSKLNQTESMMNI
jgi:hypothetical protein